MSAPEMVPSGKRPIIDGLLAMLDLLDNCPWVASCTCGWRGSEWAAEADAQSEAWVHGQGCP